ncbi:hypothetical protein [Pseudomonas protegens]|uniref:hypothetical protein n=1 Tax=Pseudomonas protegens TaxID=380021 RepID=UPI0028BE61DE|nr:hypothetical protein [Pseudomonas protegens]
MNQVAAQPANQPITHELELLGELSAWDDGDPLDDDDCEVPISPRWSFLVAME